MQRQGGTQCSCGRRGRESTLSTRCWLCQDPSLCVEHCAHVLIRQLKNGRNLQVLALCLPARKGAKEVLAAASEAQLAPPLEPEPEPAPRSWRQLRRGVAAAGGRLRRDEFSRPEAHGRARSHHTPKGSVEVQILRC